MKKPLVVGLVLLGLVGLAWAAELPDGIDKIKLGQPMPADDIVSIASDFGVEGALHLSSSADGKVDRIAFQAQPDHPQEALDDLTAKWKQQFGPAKSSTEKRTVWEGSKRRLTIMLWDAGGGGDDILIVLESMSDTVVGHANDGFAAFFEKFKKALAADDRDTLFASFKLPFRDAFAEMYHRPRTSFGDRGRFDAVYSRLFSAEAKSKIQGAKPEFNESYGIYTIPYLYSSLEVKRISGQWRIVDIPFQE